MCRKSGKGLQISCCWAFFEHLFHAKHHTSIPGHGKIALNLSYRRKQGSERFSNLPSVTQLESYVQELVLSDALTKGP